jgi:hypothetical protein
MTLLLVDGPVRKFRFAVVRSVLPTVREPDTPSSLEPTLSSTPVSSVESEDEAGLHPLDPSRSATERATKVVETRLARGAVFHISVLLLFEEDGLPVVCHSPGFSLG